MSEGGRGEKGAERAPATKAGSEREPGPTGTLYWEIQSGHGVKFGPMGL